MNDSHAKPDPLAFTPVPCRARHDGWTANRQRGFVTALAATGTVAAAARAVAMSVRSAYALRGRAGDDSSFARAWGAALDRGVADALAVGLQHALHGEEVPVFYGGRQVGRYRKFNDRLALATLRAFVMREERIASTIVGGRSRPLDPAERLHLALRELASSTSAADPRDDRELPTAASSRNDPPAKPY